MKKLLLYLWKYYKELFAYWINGVGKQIAQRRFQKAKIEAQRLAVNQHRKYWVIRGKRYAYFVLNSSDIQRYKDAGIFKQSINFLYLDKIADYIAMP